ncbi:two component transcriptional regulator AraC family [Clostridium sp. CAG:921]|nr:two component transcriptional regulator AraC family [Clostridium sp. CAG:921]
MIKIMLIDNNSDSIVDTINKIKEYNTSEFLISRISTTLDDAYEHITFRNPDVVIINLQIYNFNVIEFFQKLKNLEITSEIIIITSEDNLLLNKIVKNYNITRIFLQPFNFKILADCLNKINIERTKEKNKNNLYSTLYDILSKFNFNRKSIGYSYIIEIFKICFLEGCVPTPFEGKVYTKLAKTNNLKRSDTIKWNIEKSINSMKKTTDKEILEYYFDRLKITPKTFIHVVFDLIILKANQIS